MNPARAQKLNHFIVNDYFDKLERIFIEKNLFSAPQRIYNMDEKGCRLTIHHQQDVLSPIYTVSLACQTRMTCKVVQAKLIV